MIKKLIKYVVDDAKETYETIMAIIKGNAKFKYGDPKTFFFKMDIAKILKENWIFFLMIILSFTIGYWYAGNYYTAQCDLIIHNLTRDVFTIDPSFFNDSFNISIGVLY